MTSAETTDTRARPGWAKWIALGVTVLITALVVLLATRPAADRAASGNPLVGRPAPPLSGTALDGRQVDIADLRGRYVVVNFFATWCVPCRREHPELVKFTERHQGPTSPAVVAVAYDRTDVDATRSFFAREGGSWPVLGEDGSTVAVAYGVRGLPESYVVGPDGQIVAHVTGEVTADGLEALTGGVT